MKKLSYILLVLLFVGMPLGAAHATVPVNTNNPGTTAQLNLGDEEEGKVFSGKPVSEFCKSVIKPSLIVSNIIACSEKLIKKAGDKALLRFTLLFANIVFYTTILAIMVFGIRMMYGQTTTEGATFIMVAKVFVVLYFSSPQGVWTTRQWRDAIIDFPKSISVQILAAAQNQGPFNVIGANIIADVGINLGGLVGTNLGNEYLIYPLVYKKFDLMIMKMIGMRCERWVMGQSNDENGCTKNPDDKSNKERQKLTNNLFIGVAVLFVGLFFVPAIGPQIAMILFIYVTSIIFAIAELVLYFIIIALALNILAALAPLAVVCILFESTKRMFRLWFSYVLSYIAQPIFLVGFMSLVIYIVTPVIEDLDLFFEKVQRKFEKNSVADAGSDVSIYKCIGYVADKARGTSGSTKLWGTMISENAVDRVTGRTTADVNRDCGIYAKRLSFDPVTSTSKTEPDKFTSEDLKIHIGKFLGLSLIMMMFVSFMMELPRIADRIVGQSAMGLSLSTGPTRFITNTAQWGGNLLGSFAKR